MEFIDKLSIVRFTLLNVSGDDNIYLIKHIHDITTTLLIKCLNAISGESFLSYMCVTSVNKNILHPIMTLLIKHPISSRLKYVFTTMD